MIFGFGKNKSKSSSASNASTYVDPTQQPFRRDLMNQAQQLNNQGMPVEGVAGINPNLAGALQNQYMGGNMQAGAGVGLMGSGSALAGGSGSALRFSNHAMMGLPQGNMRASFGAGNRYAGGVAQGGIAQGSGVNSGMANEMAGNAVNANAAVNQGADVGSAGRYGDQAMMGTAAQGQGPNLGMASQIEGMAGQSAGTQNQGFNQSNLSNYINNDVLQGQIDASTRDITRNLAENQLTGNASNAAASGNSGSSRRAVMDAIATRGAEDRSADVAANMRGNAYSQGLGIEANRAQQNAQMGQQNQQFNTGQSNNMLSQGINTATGVDAMNTGYRQQQGMANQNSVNQFTGQGFGIDAARASQNAGFDQQSNMFNAGAGNALLGQGYGIGASQLESNLGRQQQGNQFNAGQFNQARQFGTGVGQNAFNTNQQNQQFGASLAARLGAQGTADMRTGAGMFNTGVGQQLASGQYGRDFEQQLMNQQFRQGMAPFSGLNFYNQIVGAPNNLSNSNTTSSGKSSGFNFSI